MLHSPLTLHVPHNQSTSVSFGHTHTPLPTSITKTYPQINVSLHVCNNVFISATVTKKITCLTWIPQHSYWPNLKHTPSVYKLNIFMQLQALIHDNFLNLSQKLLRCIELFVSNSKSAILQMKSQTIGHMKSTELPQNHLDGEVSVQF